MKPEVLRSIERASSGTLRIRRALAWAASLAVLLSASTAIAARDIVAKSPVESGGYRITEGLSIGGPDADDPAQFYERLGSANIAADGSGNIYVLDNGNIRIQVFGTNGNFLRTIGQEGEGPGEFQMPSRMAVNAAGDLAVFDMATQRVTLFDSRGELIRDQIVEGVVRDLILRDDRSMICSLGGDVEMVAFGPKGESLWEYGRKAPDPRGMVMELKIEGNLSTVGTRLVETSSGILLGSEDEYALSSIQEGELVASLSRPFDRVDMVMPDFGDDDDDEEGGGPRMVMITMDDDGGGGGGGQSGDGGSSFTMEEGEGVQLNMDDIQKMMPKHQADIRGLLAWPDDRVWVITAADDGEEMVTDEWSEDGRYLRRFAIPRYDRYALGADGQLYGLGHDDDDYPIVYRLHVETIES